MWNTLSGPLPLADSIGDTVEQPPGKRDAVSKGNATQQPASIQQDDPERSMDVLSEGTEQSAPILEEVPSCVPLELSERVDLESLIHGLQPLDTFVKG